MSHLLTVAIPTFNRPKALRRCLEKILPQIGPQCRLVVLDNHSEPSMEPLVRECLAEYPTAVANYVRNPYNFGAAGNLLKCFEHANSQWVWILSDDDCPQADAVHRLLCAFEKSPDAGLLVFHAKGFDNATTANLSSPVRAHCLDELLVGIGLMSAGLISSAVYRVEVFRKLVQIGYLNCDTYYPHLAMILAGLERRQIYVVGLPESIVEFSTSGHEEHAWSMSILENHVKLVRLVSTDAHAQRLERSDLSVAIRSYLRQNKLQPAWLDILLAYATEDNVAARAVILSAHQARMWDAAYKPCRMIGLTALLSCAWFTLLGIGGFVASMVIRLLGQKGLGLRGRVRARLARFGKVEV